VKLPALPGFIPQLGAFGSTTIGYLVAIQRRKIKKSSIHFMSKAKSILLKPLLFALILGSFAALQASAAEGVEFDVRPMPIKTPPPEYPSAMKQGGISGLVALKVEIDENGFVTACAVSKSSNPEFEQPAINAVKNWKFKPAQKSGNPVKIRIVIPIKFSIEE